jgi:hypothetical protein
VGDGSNETSKVQLALNSLPAGGGDVQIPPGVKFNLRSLTFPAKSNLIYRADDDLSAPGQGSDIGSGEWVNFSANSSYPADPTGGAVNEWRFTAPFHPGVVVDVRKDVTGANSGLGTGQTTDDPVRASFNIMDEQTDTFRIIYENHLNHSNFAGVGVHVWRREVVLNGIGTAQWATLPAENTLITGVTSGAKGHLLSVGTTSTTLLWFSGHFQDGEKVKDNDETTTASIASVSFSLKSMPVLAQGAKRGNWTIGLPSDAVRDQFVVGGKIAVSTTRLSPAIHSEETIVNPGFVWVDSYERSTVNGYEIVYDTLAATEAQRRLHLTKYNSDTPISQIGGLAAHASFNDGGGAPYLKGGEFNVGGVVRGGSLGKYEVTFKTALPTAQYRVVFGAQFKGFLTCDLKTTAGFSIFVSNATGVDQWASFDIDFVVIGGDI